MQKCRVLLCVAFAAASLSAAPRKDAQVAPGQRVMIMAHNAFPKDGKWNDRLDRALQSGTPLGIEIDLVYSGGKSFINTTKNLTGHEPTLKSYFFERVRPMVEKAIRDGSQSNWPIITLFLDIGNDPVEHLEAIAQTLKEYEPWLTSARKPKDDSSIADLDLKPLMVVVEDKTNDVKQKYFYDRLPVGGKVTVFGTAPKFDPASMGISKADIPNMLAKVPLDKMFPVKANTYRRWSSTPWDIVEVGDKMNASAWGPEQAARLKAFVDYGHKLGYLVGLYALDAFTDETNQGWSAGYNFGSMDVVRPRWIAAAKTGADFISTDQYEEAAKAIRGVK
jgi:hypothetical protein